MNVESKLKFENLIIIDSFGPVWRLLRGRGRPRGRGQGCSICAKILGAQSLLSARSMSVPSLLLVMFQTLTFRRAALTDFDITVVLYDDFDCMAGFQS